MQECRYLKQAYKTGKPGREELKAWLASMPQRVLWLESSAALLDSQSLRAQVQEKEDRLAYEKDLDRIHDERAGSWEVPHKILIADSLIKLGFVNWAMQKHGCLGCIGVILPFVVRFIISHYRIPY